jgi:hypothetical protein
VPKGEGGGARGAELKYPSHQLPRFYCEQEMLAGGNELYPSYHTNFQVFALV